MLEEKLDSFFKESDTEKAPDIFLYRRLLEKKAATYSPTNAVPSA